MLFLFQYIFQHESPLPEGRGFFIQDFSGYLQRKLIPLMLDRLKQSLPHYMAVLISAGITKTPAEALESTTLNSANF